MFVVELAGLQAVVKLAEEPIEQVSLGLAVPVSGGAAGVVVAAGTGRAAQGGHCPDGADRGEPLVVGMPVQYNSFLVAGTVDGAEPAKALSPRASAKRRRSSPSSASTRAPASFPRPGKLVMISASG